MTNTNGTATIVYTAPPPPPLGTNPAASSVSIHVIVVGTDPATNAVATIEHSVDIRLIFGLADTPTPFFTWAPLPVNVNVPVTFDASNSCPGAANLDSSGKVLSCKFSTSAAITNYAWNFGDGATGSGRTVSHTFTTARTFNVTLTITNDRGVTASTTQQISAAATAVPTAVFTPSTGSPGINQVVNFNAGASTAAAGRTIASYSWNFGDGATGGGINITHAYAAAGTFTVTLTVTDDLGQNSLPASQTETVTAAPPPGAFADFTFSPPIGDTIRPVHFDASASKPSLGGGPIVSWVWNFGDGTPVVNNNGPIADYQYKNPSPLLTPFTVTLTVTDTLGRTGTVSKTIVVQ
jgi:PKD repeat protein